MANKLARKKVDVSYIDPTTGKVVCTFNQCLHKFTVQGFEMRKNEYDEDREFFFHACSECGRKEQTRMDKGKGEEAYEKRAIARIEGKK